MTLPEAIFGSVFVIALFGLIAWVAYLNARY